MNYKLIIWIIAILFLIYGNIYILIDYINKKKGIIKKYTAFSISIIYTDIAFAVFIFVYILNKLKITL
jgi:hypothetical protein